MTYAERRSLDEELGINPNRPLISDAQILEWLMEVDQRVDNPDCPPFDPKLGL